MSHPAHLGVILNRNAAAARRPGLGTRLAMIAGRDGDVRETYTPEQLHRALSEFAARGVDLVAACGGDGTNLTTISEMVRVYGRDHLPRFAPLRGGTVNTIASNLGVRGTPEEILQRIVSDGRDGHPPVEVEHDLLDVNGRQGFLFAGGLGARFLEAYYAAPVRSATWASLLAARIAVSAVWQGPLARRLFAAVPCRLVADGEALALTRVRLLVASVVPDVGIGMRLAWQAGRAPGRFHLVASALSPRSMALQIPRVRAGRPLAGAAHVDRLARAVVVEFDEPQPYTLDGDMFRDRRIEIGIGPRLRLVLA